MPHIVLGQDVELETHTRGWQLAGDLTLNDQVRCAQWPKQATGADGCVPRPDVVWCDVTALAKAHTSYMQFFAGDGFLLTFDEADVALHKGAPLPQATSPTNAHPHQRGCAWADASVRMIFSHAFDSEAMRRVPDELRVWDADLEPVVLDFAAGTSYRWDHKLWHTVFRVEWDAAIRSVESASCTITRPLDTTTWAAAPLLRQQPAQSSEQPPPPRAVYALTAQA